MRKYTPFILTLILTVPGLLLRTVNFHEINPIIITIITAFAIFSASFILTWCCEVMQIDIPQTVAIALVALIAVLPEYAVDIYFTWMAGKYPESEYVTYAIANMTGANRLLIGIGWSAVILIFAIKYGKKLLISCDHKTEILFLLFATSYAFIIPLKGSLSLIDSFFLIGIFVWYITIIVRKPIKDEGIEGPAAVIASFPKRKRIATVWGLFIYAALVILACAELFSEGLVASGKLLGINEFLLVQWLAPIASEAPEFIIALSFAIRGNGALALGALISSKLNQWTLLVGMIPLVYSASSSSLSPIPLSSFQLHEILLTAAQSLFAVSLIIGLIVGKREALMLLILFFLQFLSPLYYEAIANLTGKDITNDTLHMVFSIIYVALAIFFILKHPRKFIGIFKGVRADVCD